LEHILTNLSLFRKYRSQNFDQLQGQQHIIRTLQNGIKTGRIAQAYLFTGPRGTGKTSTARILAKALNCESGPSPEPCNTCEICKTITDGSNIDVIEKDAASESGVDDVREAIVQVTEYQPSICRYKIFIIDEVHDLSPKAFDALLKTIEEPPAHVIFILATTEYHKVPPTIRSRCQKFEFHQASLQEISSLLKKVLELEGVQAEPGALLAVARMADGSYRDSLTILEKAILTANGHLTLEHVYDQLGLINEEVVDNLLQSITTNDHVRLINILDEIFRQGKEPKALVESILSRLSDLTRSAYGIDAGNQADSSLESALHAAAAHLGKDKILAIRQAIAQAHKTIRDISLPKIWLESELIRICLELSGASRPVAAKPVPKTVAIAEPVTNYKPEKPVVATVQQLAAPKAMSQLEHLQHRWASVISNLSKISKTASARLSKSNLQGHSANRLEICFKREMDRDWVQDNPKVQSALQQEWEKLGGESNIAFEFVVNPDAHPKTDFLDEVTEVPAVGDRLIGIAQDVFTKS
jgi:DNA polymerase-3 subunit gamma/tau